MVQWKRKKSIPRLSEGIKLNQAWTGRPKDPFHSIVRSVTLELYESDCKTPQKTRASYAMHDFQKGKTEIFQIPPKSSSKDSQNLNDSFYFLSLSNLLQSIFINI